MSRAWSATNRFKRLFSSQRDSSSCSVLLSYESLYDALSDQLIKVTDIKSLEVLGLSLDPRHVKRDKRRRKSPVKSGIQSLT